jgi:hypothetical protein
MKVAVSTTRNAFLYVAVLLFLAPPMASGHQSEDTVPFDTIVKYLFGGPFEPGASPVIYVVTDRREWKKVWKLAHVTFQARPLLPEIDFSNRMVLAIFHEYIGGSCNRSIRKLVVTEDGLKVFVKQTCPDCAVQPANVQKPVEIIETERLEKTIRKKEPKLVVELETIPCKPPNPASN